MGARKHTDRVNARERDWVGEMKCEEVQTSMFIYVCTVCAPLMPSKQLYKIIHTFRSIYSHAGFWGSTGFQNKNTQLKLGSHDFLNSQCTKCFTFTYFADAIYVIKMSSIRYFLFVCLFLTKQKWKLMEIIHVWRTKTKNKKNSYFNLVWVFNLHREHSGTPSNKKMMGNKAK